MNATSDRRYRETIERFEGLYRGSILPATRVGLRRAEYLLDHLGNPQRAFRSVHVAGSTGKGSTTSMIGSVLQAAGFKTGIFRSPHLFEYTERISVNGRDIDRDSWVRLAEQVWPLVEAMRDGRAGSYDLGRPSFSEVLFSLMALHFAETGVEWASIETGLGGRLDATNVVSSDVAVITNISLEHTRILGDSIAAIAAEKAAIIKSGSHAVTASESPDALRVIEARATNVGAPLRRVGREIEVEIIEERIDGQNLDLHGDAAVQVSLPLAGRFQARNAAAAFGAIEALGARGVRIPEGAIVSGMADVRIPGRLEIASYQPLVLLDGGHNPAAIRELMLSMDRLFPGRRLVVLFAAMADKDIRSMAIEIAMRADQVVLTPPPGTDRAASVELLEEAFAGLPVTTTPELDSDLAYQRALGLLGIEDILLVTGSLYLVGYLRHVLLGSLASP